MAKVVKRENETVEGLLKRFQKKINDERILADMKKKEFYLSKTQKRREKDKVAAAKRRKIARKQVLYESQNRTKK